MRAPSESGASPVEVPVGREHLAADLAVPGEPRGLVIFACHSGTGRFSSRNLDVARALQRRGLATLAVDLLTPHEEVIDRVDGCLRVNIDQLGDRLVAIIDWARSHPVLRSLSLGLYGPSTGATAAVVAASARPRDVAAIVSRGGRPDLAGAVLSEVEAPTLLLVGSLDPEVVELNRWAKMRMRCPVLLNVIAGGAPLYEEPAILDQVAARTCEWFEQHLEPGTTRDDAP